MTLTTNFLKIIPSPEGEENTTRTEGEDKILCPEGARSIRNKRSNLNFGSKWTNMDMHQIQKAKARTLNSVLIPSSVLNNFQDTMRHLRQPPTYM